MTWKLGQLCEKMSRANFPSRRNCKKIVVFHLFFLRNIFYSNALFNLTWGIPVFIFMNLINYGAFIIIHSSVSSEFIIVIGLQLPTRN